MAENKLGGNNLPDKGEQGFRKSKAGKTAPTASSLPKMGLLKNSDQGEPEVICKYMDANLATVPWATVEDLFEFAKYGNSDVRQKVAERDKISLETFDLLMLDKNYDVLKSLAGNANLPKEYFRPLFDKVINTEYLYFTPEVHTYHTLVGQKTSTSPLGEYKIDEDKKIWFKGTLVGRSHKYFDESLIEELSKDKSPWVRECIIRNRDTSVEILSNLVKNDKKWKLRKLAKNEISQREKALLESITPKKAKCSYCFREISIPKNRHMGESFIHSYCSDEMHDLYQQ